MKEIRSIIYLLCVILTINGVRTQIFGGSEAPEGIYKYHAYLSVRSIINGVSGTVYCGGSVIDKRYVLTAAHCFNGENIEKIQIKVGTIFRLGQTGTIYHVVKRIDHEAYDKATFSNDIALLRVDRDIVYNDKVQPVRLPSADTRIDIEETVIFTGFGRKEDNTNTNKLRTVELKMFDYQVCRQVERRVTQTQICTMPRDGKGPCIGDSGGPLVNRNGIQVGIDSFAYKRTASSCGEVPEIYTRLPNFRDWIDEKMRQN